MVQPFKTLIGEQGQAISVAILAFLFCGAVLLRLI